MDLSLNIFKLKSEDRVEDLFREMKEALKEAEEALEDAEDKYETAKETKDKDEKKLARKNVLSCRRRRAGVKHRKERVLAAKKDGVRYIDKALCLNIKRENAPDELSKLIESGDLMESDREIVGRLFHQGYSKAKGIPDINVKITHERKTFYEIIKKIHAGLEKLKLL